MARKITKNLGVGALRVVLVFATPQTEPGSTFRTRSLQIPAMLLFHQGRLGAQCPPHRTRTG